MSESTVSEWSSPTPDAAPRGAEAADDYGDASADAVAAPGHAVAEEQQDVDAWMQTDELAGDEEWTEFQYAVAQLRVDVDAIAAALEKLAGVVQSLAAGGGGGGAAGSGGEETKPSRWAWRYTGADGASRLWHELREFVDWLNSRYAQDSERQIPPCWYQHPIAVEELTALMSSWQAAYHGPDTPRDNLLAWHSYWLWPCMDRLSARAGWQRCRSGQHQDRSARIQETDAGFDAFVRSQLDAHTTDTDTALTGADSQHPSPTGNGQNVAGGQREDAVERREQR
jgi:hypothetical protein